MEAGADEARHVSVVACRRQFTASAAGEEEEEEEEEGRNDTSTTDLVTAAAAAPVAMNTGADTADDPKRGAATADHVVLTEAIQHEHSLAFWQAVKLYPAAVGWSMFVSIGVIMTAFDPQLLGNLYATPQFAADFGYMYEGETGLSMGNPIGQVVGALISAYPMELFGRKWTLAICVALTGGLVFIQFFARSLPVLLVGELLGGLVLGVCPLALRGVLTSYTNLCFVMGQLLANGVTAGTSQLTDHWAYSIPFALQWFWIAIIVPGMFFIPESPWWLVRHGRFAEAEHALRRLASKQVDVAAALAVITETDRLEQEIEAGSTYRDCFNSINARRTEISIGVYSIQVLSAVGFVATIISWYLLTVFGRRIIYLHGLSALVVLQLLIGILDCIPGRPAGVAWAESSLMLVWNFAYDLSVGPVCFTILAECSATRVRSKTIAVATAAQALVGIAMTVAIPYMINPDEANMQGKLGFFFGGLAALCYVWAFFRVPETAGRTYEELDILFAQKVPARKFKSHQVDITDPGH
ncbi:sugar porter family MFS transporter [Apiospora phragmitis]|uniref:Sugar porter family MFS transporter n=1 Tax=Apiospora phragmitis TaxID=2905665 RepID=A0ABR1WTX7_9PEZI